jgi:monoamine oxidase
MSFALFHRLQRRFASWPDAPDRREALRAALAVAGGLLCFERNEAADPPDPVGRVVVIGAGFSGLACADELAAAGYRVIVLEARDRVGGRVHSRRDLVPGKVVEAGGELVGPNQPTWMAYTKRFNLEPLPHPVDDEQGPILLNGKRLGPEDAKAVWKGMHELFSRLNEEARHVPAYQAWEMPGARALDLRSLGEWLADQRVEELVRHAAAAQWTASDGMLPSWQSYLGNLAVVKGGGLEKFWDDTDTLHIKGGTQQLAERLRDSLLRRPGGHEVRLGTPVRRVRQQTDKVVVSIAGGKTIEADDVVLTAPPNTWSRIAFDPPLPADLTVPMATNGKYLMVFKDPFWVSEGKSLNALSDGDVQSTWGATSGQGSEGLHGLMLYSGGPTADDWRSWSESERDRRLSEALTQLYPGRSKESQGRHYIDWLSDPWARGTYSFPAPGQVTTVGPVLIKGVRNHLHFAGEYACYAFAGWMEAALNSGVRLARRLCERDGVIKPTGNG